MSRLLSLFTALLLSACLESKKESPEAGIQWQKTSMEVALKKAKEQDRPLFVYWGAEWCPPCNVMKSTVFKDPLFISSTEKYLSVYLDGDTESAQKWGEKLKAMGYPTLMILNPEGEEVVRLSSSRTAASLAESLDWVFYNLKPINEIIAEVQEMPASLVDEKTWKMIANYSWGQAKKLDLKIDWAKTYSDLEAKIPSKMKDEKNRLYLNALIAKIDSLEKDKDGKVKEKLSARQIKRAKKKIKEFMSSKGETEKHIIALAYYSSDFAKNLYEKEDAKREEFIEAYRQAMEKVRENTELALNSRLISYYPMIDLTRLEEEEAPLAHADQKKIEEEVPPLYGKIKSKYEQTFVSSKVAYVLREAGLKEKAREILLKDIKTSKTPYYSMSSLASLEKKLENKSEALKWIERAYNSSQGDATRLQWGSRYLRYLFELSPKEEERIVSELQKFYREHLVKPDAFMARNGAVLKGLTKKLKEWGKEKKRKAYLQNIQKKWLDRCEKKSQTKTEYYHKACKDYFTGLI